MLIIAENQVFNISTLVVDCSGAVQNPANDHKEVGGQTVAHPTMDHDGDVAFSASPEVLGIILQSADAAAQVVEIEGEGGVPGIQPASSAPIDEGPPHAPQCDIIQLAATSAHPDRSSPADISEDTDDTELLHTP